MKMRIFGSVAVVLVAAAIALGAGKSESFTGVVSDAMCGAKHMMDGDAACTRACVKKGSAYALVVGEKAKITGVASEETIEVSKVAAAK